MTPAGGAWNEAGQSETPAVEFLKNLGYAYVPPETLDAERDTLRDAVLVARLRVALKRLNPWISDDNLHKCVRAITSVPAASLIEANETLHTSLTFGIALEQGLGEGRKGQQVRFFDFEQPEKNDFVVTRQFKVKGAKKHVIPDVVCFVNGIPLVINRGQEPNARRRLEARSARPIRPLSRAVG
jgi:type I restriction enzyme R subunit